MVSTAARDLTWIAPPAGGGEPGGQEAGVDAFLEGAPPRNAHRVLGDSFAAHAEAAWLVRASRRAVVA